MLTSESEYNSTVIHTSIKFRVSNFSSIHCYNQNLKDIVLKSTLVQQGVELVGRGSVEKVSHRRDERELVRRVEMLRVVGGDKTK